MIYRVTILATLLLATSLLAQSNTEPPPTMAELQQLMTDKQWQPLLQKIAKVLPLRGAAAQPYDRYELFMMRGEANLQLKQNAGAVQAFGDAAKEASATNKQKAAVALTSALLVKRSTAHVYKRKSPTTQPSDAKEFDILDTAKRKDAFAALAADESLALAPKAKAAAAATGVRPIIEVMKSLEDLKNAELASDPEGKTATPLTDAIVTPLANHAKDLSTQAVSKDRVSVDTIEKSANTPVPVADHPHIGANGQPVQGIQSRYKRRGLMGMDSQTLRNVIDDCGQVSTVDKQLAETFGDVGKPLLAVADDAQKLIERAKVILNTDYTITSDNPNSFR